MKSIKGLGIKTTTNTGQKARLTTYVFPNGDYKVIQMLFTEPEYEVGKGEVCVRETANYKLIRRQLVMKNKTAMHLFDMLGDLQNYYNNFLEE